MKKVLPAVALLLLVCLSGCGNSAPIFSDSPDAPDKTQSTEGTSSNDNSVSLSLDLGEKVTATLVNAEFCTNLSDLVADTEKWSLMDNTINIVGEDGQLNPRVLNGGDGPAEILLVKQCYTNISDTTIDLSLLSNKVAGLDPVTHNAIEDLTGSRHYCAVYLSVSEEGLQKDTDRGFWIVSLPQGKTVEVTIGYAVPQNLEGKEIQYTFSPFGDTDQDSATASVRF